MELTADQVMEMARKNGMDMTREAAAVQAYCFNEAAIRKTSPLVIMAELQDREKAVKNLGKIDANSGLRKKPTWQL